MNSQQGPNNMHTTKPRCSRDAIMSQVLRHQTQNVHFQMTGTTKLAEVSNIWRDKLRLSGVDGHITISLFQNKPIFGHICVLTLCKRKFLYAWPYTLSMDAYTCFCSCTLDCNRVWGRSKQFYIFECQTHLSTADTSHNHKNSFTF